MDKNENKFLSVLILAHKNEEQLLRLIKSLQHDEIDIYI